MATVALTADGQTTKESTTSKRKTTGKQSKPFAIYCSICGQKAISLPKPIYPAHFNGSGTVSVKVLINEVGNVVSTKVVSGHPLLRAASVNAASKAKFTPTRIGGNPVKIYTTIVYNFKRSE